MSLLLTLRSSSTWLHPGGHLREGAVCGEPALPGDPWRLGNRNTAANKARNWPETQSRLAGPGLGTILDRKCIIQKDKCIILDQKLTLLGQKYTFLVLFCPDRGADLESTYWGNTAGCGVSYGALGSRGVARRSWVLSYHVVWGSLPHCSLPA